MINKKEKKPDVALPTPGEEGKEIVKKGKYKYPGYLADQTLKYNYPKNNKDSQLSMIFDALNTNTQKKIEDAEVDINEIVEGVKLSTGEQKVIDCLCKLLHKKSQTSQAEKNNYYSGNAGTETIVYGGEKTLSPKIAFTIYELTKEYKGGDAVSGKDAKNVKSILTELGERYFLLSYTETSKTPSGGRIERKIEDFRKLIHILKISQTEYNKEDIELSKKEETIVVLNPIFRRYIESNYISYPDDLLKRTIIAYGSPELSEIVLKLRTYLMRELSKKRYTPEIKLDKLYYLLHEQWMRESRKKKVRDYTEKALVTMKNLGLLISYDIVTGATGEPKIVFTLNKDFE